MTQHLGSRKRFIFRLVIYGLLPGIGLFVLVYSWGDTAGMLMGAMGVAIGLMAQYMLYARLTHPISAFQFALKPNYVVNRIATQALSSGTINTEEALLNEISYLTKQHYPDVLVERRGDDADEPNAVVLGEEFILFSTDSTDDDHIEELKQGLQTPLKNEVCIAIHLADGKFAQV